MFPATRIAPLIAVLLCLPESAFAAKPAFRLHTIDASSTYSAAAAIDVNRDGKLDGVPLNPAVFVYVAEVEFNNGEIKIFEGDLTLVK